MSKPASKSTKALWSETVGFIPNKIWVGERADKGGVLYTRRRAGGNWKWRSLGVTLRDERGRILPAVQRMAREEALRDYEVASGRRAPDAAAAPAAPLAVGGAWAVLADPKTGLYPPRPDGSHTPHAREVARALRDAARIWGADTPFAAIDRARIRMLGRTRVDELRAAEAAAAARQGRAPDAQAGFRGAEVTVLRVLTAAAWLRDEGHLPADACLPPRKWRDDVRAYWSQAAAPATGLRREPEPKRPRYTHDEALALLAAAPKVDPRYALLVALGAELRLGQVVRCRRSDLSLEHATLAVRGVRGKRGTVVQLTAGQVRAVREALDAAGDPPGYLWRLESALPDYPLFPAGQLPGGRSGRGVADPARHGAAAPIEGTAWRKWHAAAEAIAAIAHARGRGPYGLRRRFVDEAKRLRISREGLKAHGGWSDTQVPDRIYADQEAEYAAREAAEVRAKFRREPQEDA